MPAKKITRHSRFVQAYSTLAESPLRNGLSFIGVKALPESSLSILRQQ